MYKYIGSDKECFWYLNKEKNMCHGLYNFFKPQWFDNVIGYQYKNNYKGFSLIK